MIFSNNFKYLIFIPLPFLNNKTFLTLQVKLIFLLEIEAYSSLNINSSIKAKD